MPAVLTTKMVEKAIRDTDTYDLSDARVPGLSIRSRAGGAVWMVRVNHKKHTVGPAADLPLPQARALATELIARVKAGFAVDAHWIQRQKVAMGVVEDGAPALPDPVVRKKTWTWEEALEAYLKEVKRVRREATAKNYRSILTNPSVVEALAGKFVVDIDRATMAGVIHRIHASGREATAENVTGVIRTMWEFLANDARQEMSGVTENVMRILKKPQRSRGYGKKTRTPTLEACGRIVAACRLGVFEPTIAIALEVLLLTAQRRMTIASVRREHVVVSPLKIWQIPGDHIKGGLDHFLPLTPRLRELFSKAQRETNGDWMFPQVRARRRGMDMTHVNESTLSHNLSDFGAGASPHDVRRAFVTAVVQEAGMKETDAALVLDHREGRHSVTATHYNRATFLPEKMAVLEAWQAALEPHIAKAMDEMDPAAEKARLAEKRQAKSRYKTGVRPKLPNIGKQLRIERAAKDAVVAALRDRKTQEDGRIRDVLSMVAERRIGDEEAMHLLRLDNALSLLISLSNFGFDAHARADLATEAATTALEKGGLRSPFGATTPEAASAAREILHACVDYVIETAAQHYRKPPAARSGAGRPAGRQDLHAV